MDSEARTPAQPASLAPTRAADPLPSRFRCVVFRIGDLLAAAPLHAVVETLRPLAIERLPETASSVVGAALIRGVVTPVVDARVLFAIADPSPPARWIVLRVGERTVALAVDHVIGMRTIESADLENLPRLLGGAANELVARIGSLDAEFLVVLDDARLVTDAVWNHLEPQGGSR